MSNRDDEQNRVLPPGGAPKTPPAPPKVKAPPAGSPPGMFARGLQNLRANGGPMTAVGQNVGRAAGNVAEGVGSVANVIGGGIKALGGGMKQTWTGLNQGYNPASSPQPPPGAQTKTESTSGFGVAAPWTAGSGYEMPKTSGSGVNAPPVAPPTSQSQKTAGGIPRTFEGQVDGFNITQQGGVQVIKPSKPDGIDPMDKAKLQMDQQKFAKDVLGQMGDEERGNLRLMASTFQEAVQPAMDGNGPSDGTRAAGLQFGAQLVAAGVDPVMSAAAAGQAAQQEAAYVQSQAAQLAQLSAEQQQAAIAKRRAEIQQVMRNLVVQPPQQSQQGSDEESASPYPYSPTF